MPANHSYKNTYRKNNNGETSVKWEFGNKTCKRTWSSGARPKKMRSILICFCLGLQKGETGDYAENSGGRKGKSVTLSLWKKVSPPYTILKNRLLYISWVSREQISGNPDSPTFPHIGESPILGNPLWRSQFRSLQKPAASLRGQKWIQHSTPDTVRHWRIPLLG